MLAELKFQKRLKKLSAGQAKTTAYYNRKLKEARKQGKNKDDIMGLDEEAYFEYSMAQEEIDMLITDRLTSKARKLILPLPAFENEEMWKKCHDLSSRFVLTSKGIAELRKNIRSERKDRRDVYIPWIAIAIGLIGALTGLLAVILK